MKYIVATYLDSVNLNRDRCGNIRLALDWIEASRAAHPLACHSIYRAQDSHLIAQWELGRLTVNRASGEDKRLIEATR